MKTQELKIGNWILFDAYGESNYQVSKDSFNEVTNKLRFLIDLEVRFMLKTLNLFTNYRIFILH